MNQTEKMDSGLFWGLRQLLGSCCLFLFRFGLIAIRWMGRLCLKPRRHWKKAILGRS